MAYPSAAPLEFRHVGKRYPGADRAAIEDLSFEVPAGEICVLVGPSGCGKTTAMRLVNRMIDLTSGEILLDGRSVTDRKPAELRREIGYVIQQIGLFPHQTIAQNIATVPKLLGWDKRRTEARVTELLELIGLDPDLGRRYPSQLSGGQRQRVGVARALAADPPLMLMDEPFGAIDPINRERLQDEFLRLQREIRKTIVFVTHDIDEAIKMGDRIAIMREGGRARAVRDARRAAGRPGRRVRRQVRRRRPRPQAADAQPPRRHRADRRRRREGRRPGRGGAPPRRRPRRRGGRRARRRREARSAGCRSRGSTASRSRPTTPTRSPRSATARPRCATRSRSSSPTATARSSSSRTTAGSPASSRSS